MTMEALGILGCEIASMSRVQYKSGLPADTVTSDLFIDEKYYNCFWYNDTAGKLPSYYLATRDGVRPASAPGSSTGSHSIVSWNGTKFSGQVTGQVLEYAGDVLSAYSITGIRPLVNLPLSNVSLGTNGAGTKGNPYIL